MNNKEQPKYTVSSIWISMNITYLPLTVDEVEQASRWYEAAFSSLSWSKMSSMGRLVL